MTSYIAGMTVFLLCSAVLQDFMYFYFKNNVTTILNETWKKREKEKPSDADELQSVTTVVYLRESSSSFKGIKQVILQFMDPWLPVLCMIDYFWENMLSII